MCASNTAVHFDVVPLIERAFRAPDPTAALLVVLRKIKAVELETGAAEDAARFDRFMESALRDVTSERRRLAGDAGDVVQEIMVPLAAHTFKGDDQDRRTAVDLILAPPARRKE